MTIVRRYSLDGARAQAVDGFLVDDSRLRERRRSLAFCLLFFPMLALSMLSSLTVVKVTVRFGPGWFVTYAALMLGLAACIWGSRQKLQGKFFPNGDATPVRILGRVFAGGLGFACVTGYAVFGGAPVVAHYLTSHPGELLVTVTGKESTHRHASCSPRLNIDEFTFFLHDYLCPSVHAFNEISVGAKIRLEGEVSPFGITVKRYYWKKARSSPGPRSRG